ncbi:MAG: aspartate 1-decarboxylase [bacterium]
MRFREMLRAKIHNARVTDVLLHYEGSITIDRELLEKAGILPGEKVQVLNLNNGERFTTYVIEGDKGQVILNGPAARLAYPGDIVLVLAYSLVSDEEANNWTHKVIYLDENNQVVKVEEKGGQKS